MKANKIATNKKTKIATYSACNKEFFILKKTDELVKTSQLKGVNNVFVSKFEIIIDIYILKKHLFLNLLHIFLERVGFEPTVYNYLYTEI